MLHKETIIDKTQTYDIIKNKFLNFSRLIKEIYGLFAVVKFSEAVYKFVYLDMEKVQLGTCQAMSQ